MLQQPNNAPDEGSLHRYTVEIPEAMIDRLDKLARKAGRLMQRDVTRAALFRAALLFWLAKVSEASAKTLLAEIREAAPLPLTLLRRSRPTWSNELNARLDKLRERLGVELSHCTEGARTALVLAALRSWLPTAEDEPLKAFDAIRAGLVKRGRKPKR